MGEQLYVVNQMSSANNIPCDDLPYDPYSRHLHHKQPRLGINNDPDESSGGDPGMLTLLSLFCVIAILGTLAVVITIYRQNMRARSADTTQYFY